MAGPQANRTDLNVPTVAPQAQGQPNGQPVAVPTGLPYGEAGQLQQAQQALPLPAGGAAGAGTPSPGAPPGMGTARQAARQFQPPALGKLDRPTDRPNEPVTTGLPSGGLPIGQPPPGGSGGISAMLSRMAASTQSSALSQLAQRAQAAGQ